jgi:hypothetical protein
MATESSPARNSRLRLSWPWRLTPKFSNEPTHERRPSSPMRQESSKFRRGRCRKHQGFRCGLPAQLRRGQRTTLPTWPITFGWNSRVAKGGSYGPCIARQSLRSTEPGAGEGPLLAGRCHKSKGPNHFIHAPMLPIGKSTFVFPRRPCRNTVALNHFTCCKKMEYKRQRCGIGAANVPFRRVRSASLTCLRRIGNTAPITTV